MRRLFSALLALVLTLALVPAAGAAESASVTIGFLPDMTRDESVVVRGKAPRGKTVAFYVNGELVERIIAGPSMDTYFRRVPLQPGENQIVAMVEGTEAQAEGSIVRVTKSFDDVVGHKHKDDAEMLASLEIINGIGEGKFGPDLPLTRAQFAKMVALGLKLAPAANPTLTFTDSADLPDWATGFVAVAVEKGLIAGFEDGSFRPDEPVTRAQVAVIGARGLRHKGVAEGKGNGRKFKDDAKIPGWAKADVEFTASAGLIGEFWGEEFDPDIHATRGLAAAVVRRLYTAK